MKVEQACQILKRGDCFQISPKHGPTRGGWGDRAGSKRGAVSAVAATPLHTVSSLSGRKERNPSLPQRWEIHDGESLSRPTTSCGSIPFLRPG
jgi:hypothetical protein